MEYLCESTPNLFPDRHCWTNRENGKLYSLPELLGLASYPSLRDAKGERDLATTQPMILLNSTVLNHHSQRRSLCQKKEATTINPEADTARNEQKLTYATFN